jgi:hypothetical protein
VSGNEHQSSGSEDRVDEIARGAGAALRRPAPPDGVARVRSSQRRRRTARTVAGGSAIAVIGVGLFLIVDRGSEDASLVTDSGPETVSPDTVSTVPEVIPSTVEPVTESTLTVEPPATAPANESGWRQASERFPALAFIACCGADWQGEPSPPVPTDPAVPLPAGIYNVRAVVDQQSADDFVDGAITLEVRPYTRCNELGEFECSGDPPYDDADLGVPTDAARTIDVVLDDTLDVGVAGFECEDDQLLVDEQVATGTDVATLFAELDRAYDITFGERLRGGVDPAQLADDLAASPTAGFFDPGCPSYQSIAWKPSRGPTVIARSLYRLDAASAPEPFPSAAAAWIIPTALVVDERGDFTVYLYAGFLS